MMTSRERVLTALDHREPDRVPIDVGSMPVSGICAGVYPAIVEALGLPPRDVRIIDVPQQLAAVDDDVLRELGGDCIGIAAIDPDPPTAFDDDGEYESYRDVWGALLRRPHGGFYFDLAEHPLTEPTLDALDAFQWPDPDDPRRYAGLRDQARQLRETTDYAIVARPDFGSDILGIFQHTRGYTESLLDLAANPDFADAYFERATEIAVRAWTHFLAELGEYVDVVATFDDLGMQDRPLMSPKMYRRFLKHRHARIFEAIRRYTKARILFHTDGAIVPFLDDLVEVGVQVLNPIQVSSTGLEDTAELKRRFGKELTFWGAACDSQVVLSRGSVEDVRRETERRIRDLAPGG
ncbi:MAG: hypothetical protein EPO22_04180, partial [Dehalococcoidia bacterium]